MKGDHYHCSVCSADLGTESKIVVPSLWIRNRANVVKWFCITCFKEVER